MLFLIIIAVKWLYCIKSELDILLEVIYLPFPLGLWREHGSVNDDGVTHLPFISSGSFFLPLLPFCPSPSHCGKGRKSLKYCLGVYSVLGTWPTCVNIFPVPPSLWASEQPSCLSQSRFPCWASLYSEGQAWNPWEGTVWPGGLRWPTCIRFLCRDFSQHPSLLCERQSALQAP